MGKGTDKLYITHSEWASDSAYSASAGSNVSSKTSPHASFKRLPYNFCSLSLQPFSHPVCTSTGTIFDLTNILPWLKKHGTDPVTGATLKSSELIKLNFAKNESEEYVDPVTYKRFTDNTHIVALTTTGNVFAWETVERLNVKAKMWRDLVNDEEFGRKDIITLQDPQNVGARDLSRFKYLEDGEKPTSASHGNGDGTVNLAAMGNAAKVLRAKDAVAKARAERQNQNSGKSTSFTSLSHDGKSAAKFPSSSTASAKARTPYNASHHTTGLAAASFTSTGVTPHTSAALSLLTDEEYLLKPKRIKQTGFALLQTTLGPLHLTLHPLHAPKAVWNFVKLAKKGYFNGVVFHRNIRNFMIQTGDPTGTGKGGSSIWGKNFEDEFDGPLKHDTRGIVSMANKGKDTNSSQFFITYRLAKHLDRKHTIFGTVDLTSEGTASSETLNKLENSPGDSKDRPIETIQIERIDILLDPFEEFLASRAETEEKEREKAEVERAGGAEDEKMTWTGKRVRRVGDGVDNGADGGAEAGVGKYLKAAMEKGGEDDEIIGVVDDLELVEPVRKKMKSYGGFGNFEGW